MLVPVIFQHSFAVVVAVDLCLLKVYVLQGVDADAMEILLRAITRKEVDILKSDDILSVLQASSMLQFESIQKICVEMIVHQCLTVSTCLQTMVIADELDLITLHHKA